jgi:dTDP-4-amino-4,6-dideoxygalactose transaminase
MKKIPHSRPLIGAPEMAAVRRVLTSRHLAAGPEVALLEQELSSVAGHTHGIAVSSGTAALYLSLRALGVKRGDRVLIPSYVCTALLNAVAMCDASPVAADVDATTGAMTVETARTALCARVKAIVVPHLFGFPADVAGIAQLGVPIVEDCAQCVGTARVGGLSHISVFSFYATKLLAAGEGGMVATSDRRLAETVRTLHEYDKREVFSPSFNFKLSDLHAAVARAQVARLPKTIAARRALAKEYCSALAGVSGVRLPSDDVKTSSVFYRFVVRVNRSPDAVAEAMARSGVECGRPVYKPLHRYLRLPGFPGATRMHRNALSLPIFPELAPEQVRAVAGALRMALA